MSQKHYDVVIIGGGVTGGTIAHHLTLQKKRILLVLEGGIGSGRYGRSGGLLNSGFFCATPDRREIKQRLGEIERLYRWCGHLFMPLPVLWPFYNNQDQKRCTYLLESGQGYEALQKGGEPAYLERDELIHLLPVITTNQLTGGGIFDLWGVDPFRLGTLLGTEFIKQGGDLLPRISVAGIEREADQRFRIELKGARKGIVWGDDLIDLRYSGDRYIREDYLIFERQITPFGIVIKSDQEQQILLYPYHSVTILGPFKTPYYGEPRGDGPDKQITHYLLELGEQVFPGLSKHRLLRGFSTFSAPEGDQPVIQTEDKYTKVVSGGMIWSLKTAIDLQRELVEHPVGGKPVIEEPKESYPFEEMAAYAQVSIFLVERLFYRYGESFIEILKMIKNDPGLKRIVCQCEMITVAELLYAIQREYAESFSDLMRSTRAGMGSCQGGRCIQEIDRLLRGILKDRWSGGKMVHFFEKRYRGQRHIMKHEGVQELALKLASDTLWYLSEEF